MAGSGVDGRRRRRWSRWRLGKPGDGRWLREGTSTGGSVARSGRRQQLERSMTAASGEEDQEAVMAAGENRRWSMAAQSSKRGRQRLTRSGRRWRSMMAAGSDCDGQIRDRTVAGGNRRWQWSVATAAKGPLIRSKAGGRGRAATALLYVQAAGGGRDDGRDQQQRKGRRRSMAVRTQGLCVAERR